MGCPVEIFNRDAEESGTLVENFNRMVGIFNRQLKKWDELPNTSTG